MKGIETHDPFQEIPTELLPAKDIAPNPCAVKYITGKQHRPIPLACAGKHVKILPQRISRSLDYPAQRLLRRYGRVRQILMEPVCIFQGDRQAVPLQRLIPPRLHLPEGARNELLPIRLVCKIKIISPAPAYMVRIHKMFVFLHIIRQDLFVGRSYPEGRNKALFPNLIRNIL